MPKPITAASAALLFTLGAVGCERGADSGQEGAADHAGQDDRASQDHTGADHDAETQGADPMFTVAADDAKAKGLPAATISVSTDGGMSGLPFTADNRYFTLSGPPGGPFSLVVDAVKAGATETDLKNVAELRFEGQELELGEYTQINLAGADRPAITCSAGQSMARAHHLLALVEAPGERSLLIDFQIGQGNTPTPTPVGLLDHEQAGPLLKSIQIDFE